MWKEIGLDYANALYLALFCAMTFGRFIDGLASVDHV